MDEEIELTITEYELARIEQGEVVDWNADGHTFSFKPPHYRGDVYGHPCRLSNYTIKRLRNGETAYWSSDDYPRVGVQLTEPKRSEPPAIDERRLIETCSYLSDHSSKMVAEAAKLVDYDGDVRSAPLDNIQHEIDRTRQLLDEIEEQIDPID